MKKWILALFCAALCSTAQAQQIPQYGFPVAPQATPVAAQPQPKPEPIPPPIPVAPAPGKITAAPGCDNGSCGNGCTKKVCMPEPSIKVKVSIKYSSVDEGICYRTCFWPFGKDNCSTCNHGPRSTDGDNCGHPWPKRYLVKRIVTEDIPITKCTPVDVPACYGSADCGQWQHPVQPSNVGPVPELIPPPPPSKK